ncbi:MAG: hypothetical protein ACI4VI_09730 [Acutalibacteraceae bacterium]
MQAELALKLNVTAIIEKAKPPAVPFGANAKKYCRINKISNRIVSKVKRKKCPQPHKMCGWGLRI